MFGKTLGLSEQIAGDRDGGTPQGLAVSRRNFMRHAAAVGVGMTALTALARGEALAQATPGTAPPQAAPAAAPRRLTYDEVMKAAREKLYPRCRVCPECDGWACSGEVPGFGGVGSGSSFRANLESLAKLQLHLRTFHDVKKPDLTFPLWGEKLSMPILSAATGGTTYNMGGKMTEDDYINAILGGCLSTGSLGMAADGIQDPLNVYEGRLKAVSAHQGKAIAIIKPRLQNEILDRIRLVEAAGALAVGVDIDSAGRAAMALPGQTVEPKTPAQLRELVQATKLPFILKGIMTPDEAEMALQSGAAAIVVSNHGGRVLDHTPGVAAVLPAVARKVKGKMVVFADGGIRYGADVLKLLALGADAVLLGRPLIRGAFGGGKDGVALLLNKMKNELIVSMTLTGTASVQNVSPRILV
jgi:isopentenyl diphosphate isomerase/L-lactate dehydrogenase-like FMN-dependent dehydrogenase